MGLIKKIGILSVMLTAVVMPCFAKIEGGISKATFYDTEKTIMNEVAPSKEIKTEKYWEKNLLYMNKYRPLFMLSNKELYDLMPRDKISVVQRITAPSVYNISLKTSSIKKISLAPVNEPTKLIAAKKTVIMPVAPTKKTSEAQKVASSNVSLVYEQAKNPGTEPEKKIEAALVLKNSKDTSNYGFAIDLLDDVTTKEPYNAYAFYLKGELYAQKRDSENAMKNYVEALKINPTSQQCCYGIAKILEPTNKELAQKYYEKAGMK